jgi:JAB domain-containing protein similar to deubiquitination enzymes
MLLLGLEPEGPHLTERAEARTTPVALGAASAVVLSGQARRFLALQFKAYPTEFMGCMIGERKGNSIVVRRIAPADVDSSQATATHVVPNISCEAAGWQGTVGMIHSHPGAKNCWYYFPGTQVATSDLQSFTQQPYAVDAIMCGDTIVWIGRDMQERHSPLRATEGLVLPPAARQPTRGNQVAAEVSR